MSNIEFLAVTLGLINVMLIIRRNIWNYPFGLAMVVLYGWIFWGVGLYSDMILQAFFFFVQIYGWVNWSANRQSDGLVTPQLLRPAERLVAVGGTAIGAAALGWAMARWTDASMPYWDAAVAAMSVTAQLLLSIRRLENWLWWIAADIVAIGVFWTKDLRPTAGLYAIFLVLAVIGFWTWQRQLRKSAGSPAASPFARQSA